MSETITLEELAKQGTEALVGIIAERDKYRTDFENLRRHYDSQRAKNEELERQSLMLSGRLHYAETLCTQLTERIKFAQTQIEAAGMILSDIAKEARADAMLSKASAITEHEAEHIAALAAKLSPDPNPEKVDGH